MTSADFQAVGTSSERRRDSEYDDRRRKHLMFGGISVALLVLVVVAVAMTISGDEEESDGATMRSTSKSVEMLCSSTDYQRSCKSSLTKALNDTEDPDPKDLLKAAITVVFDEVSKAFNKSQNIKTKNKQVQGAIDDCRELFMDTKDELKRSLFTIVDRGMSQINKRSDELKNWLSAVMSYQRTCVDGFPEGAVKDKLEENMAEAKELTSNALAIIGQVSNFLSMLNLQGFSRKLLVANEVEAPIGSDGFPSWISDGERRLLRGKKKIKLEKNVTVSQNGHGDFTTISEALNNMPKKYEGRYIIYIKAGIYTETVNVTRKMENVTMYGEGSKKTIVTGSKNYVDGTRTFQTATAVISGRNFVAANMAFRNTAGAIKHQAVALRVNADRAIFFQCRMEGFQDTLYAQSLRQFYRSCIISGTIDFIFGDAAAVFQNCRMVVRRPLNNQQNIVTAQGRVDRHETTGFVLHKCQIVPDTRFKPEMKKFKTYLARPWKEYSRTVIMESEISDMIHPEGYMPWEGEFALKTLYYGEYKNYGPGANVTSRVKWPGVRVAMRRDEAKRFTVGKFIQGAEWLGGTGVPVRMDLY